MKAPMDMPVRGEQTRLAAFAHDLRAPMCAVSGAAQLALAAREGTDVSAQLEQILLAVHAMDRMLETLTGAHAEAFTGDMLRRDLLAVAGERAQEKGLTLSVDLCALDGLHIEADYGALVRVLVNLLGNAVKYTPPGGAVCVRTAIRETIWPRSGVRLSFIVSDTGIGMKPLFMRRMYRPFERAKESASLPGEGLGLASVRRLVRRMGGAISVRSEWGRGTAFTVSVPVRVQGAKLH